VLEKDKRTITVVKGNQSKKYTTKEGATQNIQLLQRRV
jgi:hypothetical protein